MKSKRVMRRYICIGMRYLSSISSLTKVCWGCLGACREFCFREDTIEGESRVVLLFEILYIYSLGFVFRLRVP